MPRPAAPAPAGPQAGAWRLVQEAVKAVPAVRYALGVAGIAALVALVGGLGVDYRIAIFGTVIILGLSFVLVLFARMTEFAGKVFYLPVMVATWSFLVLTLASALGLASSFFFQWPLNFTGQDDIVHRMTANGKGPVFDTPQLDGRKIDACINSQQFPTIANLQCIQSAQQLIANAFCREAGYKASIAYEILDSRQFQSAWKLYDPGTGQRPRWDADNTGAVDFSRISCER